jgi:hypothetical protein
MKEEDKELDHLFKKRLHDVERNLAYNEEDWKALEARLDKKDRKRAAFYWLRIGSGIAAMLLLFFGWWFFGSTDLDINTTTAKKIKQGNDKVSTPIVLKPAAQKNSDGQSLEKPILADRLFAKKQKVFAPNKEIIQDVRVAPRADENNLSSAVATNTATREEAPVTASAIIATTNTTTTAITPAETSTGNTTPQVAVNTTVATVPIVSDMELTTDSGLTTVPEIAKIKKLAKDKKKHQIQFAISAVAATDLNGTSPLGQGEVGNNFGALFNIGVSKRITIQTGLIYSDKPYQGNFDSYMSAYGSVPYASKYIPTSINVLCKMFDLPLNLDYRLFENGHNKFSVGTGFSSYIMLHENYQYNFDPAQNYPSKNYEVPNSKAYLFSILNLSATYERKLSQKLGIIIQPYYKLPLRDIGYGNVKLHSVGLSVGLKLNLNKSKSTH